MVDLTRDGSVASGSVAPGAEVSAPASSPSAVTNVVRMVATVGSPIAIGTGLLFYFGWVRASVQARQLGYDTAILDWSIQDYILRSINVLFIPLMALVLLALLLVSFHQRLVLPGIEGREHLDSLAPLSLRRSWLVLIPAGILLSLFAGLPSGVAVSVSVTLALLCALYGDLLDRQIRGLRERQGRQQPPSRGQLSTVAKVLVLVLLAFSVFWNTERLARIMGEAYATQIAADPRQLLAVTVYSPQSLEIEAPGVQEKRLGDRESAYRYRYEGLRLVQRSGDRYLLISELWDERSGRVIVLRETDAIRMEFARWRGG